MKRVVKKTQSPMNASLWHITLECGHGRWVAGDKPPLRAACRWCDADVVLLTEKAKKGAKVKSSSGSRNHRGCPYPVGQCTCPMSETDTPSEK